MNFGVPGFSDDDFVGPDDLMQPGPSTIVNGVACSVFLDLDEFQSLLGLGQVDGAKTGTAGRPTSKHLCIQEMERRYAADKMDARVSHEARALREWLAATHPKEPQPGAATLENSIRGRHRELKSHKTIP
jgi:hypothetical protein